MIRYYCDRCKSEDMELIRWKIKPEWTLSKQPITILTQDIELCQTCSNKLDKLINGFIEDKL